MPRPAQKHTYKEGCKKFGEQEPKAEPAAGDQEKKEPTVTRKRAVYGDPDLPFDRSGANKSSSSSSSAHPEPRVEEVAPPAPEAKTPVPLAPKEDDVKSSLRKIHAKLKDETELYKLHLKHYHMTPQSFRHRTSALKLPKEVYDKYLEICKKCEHCQKKHVGPSRSRVSGLRANSFGDLVFIDHCEAKIVEIKYVVLIVVDAATSFLAAFCTENFSLRRNH